MVVYAVNAKEWKPIALTYFEVTKYSFFPFLKQSRCIVIINYIEINSINGKVTDYENIDYRCFGKSRFRRNRSTDPASCIILYGMILLLRKI
jgi:hypothetical protein